MSRGLLATPPGPLLFPQALHPRYCPHKLQSSHPRSSAQLHGHGEYPKASLFVILMSVCCILKCVMWAEALSILRPCRRKIALCEAGMVTCGTCNNEFLEIDTTEDEGLSAKWTCQISIFNLESASYFVLDLASSHSYIRIGKPVSKKRAFLALGNIVGLRGT